MDIRKSGTNLKLLLTGETYDAIYVGVQIANADQQLRLCADLGVESIPCWQVLVQADPANGQTNVLVGNEHQGCHIVLRPGESITVPVNDVGKVYVRTVEGGGNTTVNWLAVT